MDFKNTLRREIANKLDAISNKKDLSVKLSNNLFTTKEWHICNEVFIYISFKNEVETDYIIQRAISENKTVYAPLITKKEMTFHRIDNLKSELITNKYGIKEPPAGLKEKKTDKNSLVLVPGVAFTKQGERLGRGGGFYDRYLEKNPDGYLIAIAFEDQIVDKLPTEKWDKKVHKIVTNNNIWGE